MNINIYEVWKPEVEYLADATVARAFRVHPFPKGIDIANLPGIPHKGDMHPGLKDWFAETPVLAKNSIIIVRYSSIEHRPMARRPGLN